MRGGCTIPPWPRFPRPPDNPGRPNFSRSGLEPWPILHEPSQTPRGLSADSHTPHDSGLPTASFHLRRRLIPTLRSEEHTSELQSRLHLVCRLLLEKKKPTQRIYNIYPLTH